MNTNPSSFTSGRPWLLLLILVLAFLLRAGWGWHQPDAGHLNALPDQVEYLQLAQNLLRHHQFSFYDDRPNVQEHLRAYRTPGYPLFLAACGANVTVARLLQALIGTSTVLGVFLLARRWLGRPASLCAAALLAINPYLIYFSGLILSETLYTSMLLWGMVLISMAGRGQEDGAVNQTPSFGRFHLSYWTAAGLLVTALAVLVRPSGLLLPVVLGAAAPWVNRSGVGTYPLGGADQACARKHHLFRLIPYGVLYACTAGLLTFIVLLPWAARNRIVLGKWIGTTTNGGITLYDGFNPAATGASDQTFVQKMPQVRYPRMNETSRSAYFAALARQWALAHPWKVVKLTAAKIARTWSPIPLSNEYGGRWLYVLVGAIFAVPLDLLILLGLANRRLPWAVKAFVLLPALYFTVVHGLFVGSLRYRMPAEGPMAVLGGCGLAWIADRWLGGRPLQRAGP